MQDRGNLYAGISRWVICVRKQDGKELWRTKLPKRSSITTILIEEESVFAAAAGIVYAMNPRSGDIRWQSALGVGRGVCILGNESQTGIATAIQATQAAQAAATSAAAAAAAAGAVVAATST